MPDTSFERHASRHVFTGKHIQDIKPTDVLDINSVWRSIDAMPMGKPRWDLLQGFINAHGIPLKVQVQADATAIGTVDFTFTPWGGGHTKTVTLRIHIVASHLRLQQYEYKIDGFENDLTIYVAKQYKAQFFADVVMHAFPALCPIFTQGKHNPRLLSMSNAAKFTASMFATFTRAFGMSKDYKFLQAVLRARIENEVESLKRFADAKAKPFFNKLQ